MSLGKKAGQFDVFVMLTNNDIIIVWSNFNHIFRFALKIDNLNL